MRPVSSNRQARPPSSKEKIKAKSFNPLAIKKIYSKQFASNPENFKWAPNEKICALYNRYGFLGILNSGFNSTGSNLLEISFPDTFDLSINQENGFTLFFWILLQKQPNNLMRYIIKKGNSVDDLTPTVGLLPNNTNLFTKITSSRQKIETMISNKKLEPNRIYSIALTVSNDPNEDLTEMSLYIDGALDSQISIPGSPLHNQGSTWLGKVDSTSHGIVGTICDVMLAPVTMDEEQINEINNECIECLMKSNGDSLNTAIVFENRFERTVLMEKYLKYTKSSPYIVENLQLSNYELKEIVKKFDEEERKNDPVVENVYEDPERAKMLKSIEEMLQNEDDALIIKKIYLNSKFINTVLFLANKKEDMIELQRIVSIFDILKENLLFQFDLKFIKKLSKSLNALSKEEDVFYVNLPTFFKNLKEIHDLYFPEEMINMSIMTEDNVSQMQQHESMLLQSQNYKNVIDEESQNDIYKTDLKIKALYDTKRKLPQIDENNKEDMVNQEMEGVGSDIEKEEEENHTDLVKTAEKFVGNMFEEINLKNSGELKSPQSNVIDDEEEGLFMTGTKFAQNKDKEEQKNNNNDSTNKQENNSNNQNDKKSNGESKENPNKSNINNNSGDKQNQNEEQEEPHEYDPDFPDNWADGAFEVVINHCYNCHEHSTTTRHMEYPFVDKFNRVGNEIRETFPNAVILGNYDDLEYYGCFDVYVHGLGPVFDDKNRFFLYKKNKTGRFPSATEIVDKLIALAMIYGSSINMESAQLQYLKDTKIGKKSKFYHEYPCELSETAEKIKNNYINSNKKPPRVDMEHDKFYCQNWGCGQIFVQANNKPKSCTYHPGVWQFGSYNGYWPECWSCCEGEWDSEGCTVGYHKGIRLEERVLLCLNHGEINPNTNHPDSACGKYYVKKECEGCQYHPGYVKNGTFTCCKGDKESSGCVKGEHSSVDYPDPKAKLYFYPKPVANPGILNSVTAQGKKETPTVGKLICRCDYFKKIDVVFKSTKTKMELLKTKREKELTEPRYCMNWGCESIYTEQQYEKGEVLNCCCHPGKWDHGCTGTKMEQYAAELESTAGKKVILWKPHWTCCHGDWDSKGCKMTRHRGPLISSLGPNYKRYPWPSEHQKLSFTKVITDRWRTTLERFTYGEAKVRSIVKKCWDFKKRVTNGDLPALCDDLKLYLLVVNDKVDYSMKFLDIVTYSNTVKFFATGEGKSAEVDREKFIKWWFMPYEQLLEIINPDEKPIVIYSLLQKK